MSTAEKAYEIKQRNAIPFRVKELFSVFLALYPIFCIYKAVSDFTIGDVILMLFTGYVLLFDPKRAVGKNASVFMPFTIYAGVVTVLILMFDYTIMADTAVMFRFAKLVFYMFCVIVSFCSSLKNTCLQVKAQSYKFTELL